MSPSASAVGHRVVRDVGEEGVAGADRAVGQVDRRGRGARDDDVVAVFGMPSAPTPVMTCGEARRRPGMKLPYASVREQRHVADVLVGQLDAEHLRPAP